MKCGEKMEEKKVIKISLSTFFLILAIIVIIMGVFIYKLYNEKSIDTKKTTELQAKVDNLNGTLSELQEKNNNISNTLNSNTINTDNATNTINSTNNNLSTNSSSSKYSEITKTLTNNDLLSVTDAVNNNGTYTLKGKIITVDTSKEQVTEYPFYKDTGEYKQITVSSNTKCIYSVDSYEETTDTVENVFSKELYFGGCFNFSFKNGKCISVYEVVTGH